VAAWRIGAKQRMARLDEPLILAVQRRPHLIVARHGILP
jgi:hypothetical protein